MTASSQELACGNNLLFAHGLEKVAEVFGVRLASRPPYGKSDKIAFELDDDALTLSILLTLPHFRDAPKFFFCFCAGEVLQNFFVA